MTFDEILVKIDDVVWGIPTIVLILVTGLILTIRTRGIQFTKLGRAFKQIFKKNEGQGELSGFSALCTALSATIGTGNIVGVATAIVAGGPGALFWMWFAAILGVATKYAECMLAIKYREVKEDGTVLGGPFYTIEKGMGKKWKWLAVLFAIFGVAAGLLGIGTMTQINGITSAANNFFDKDASIYQKELGLNIHPEDVAKLDALFKQRLAQSIQNAETFLQNLPVEKFYGLGQVAAKKLRDEINSFR